MKSKPRTIFLFCLLFLLIYFLADKLVMFGVSRCRITDLGKVSKVCAHDQLPELAIFGSSVGEVGINAALLQRQTNLATYNFCIDGTTFSQLSGLIDEFSENNNKTKFVILTEAYFSLTRPEALTKMERYIAHISNKHIYPALYDIQPAFAWKCRYVPLYEYTSVSYEFYQAAWDGWKRYFNKGGIDTLLGYTPSAKKWQLGKIDPGDWEKQAAIKTDSLVVEKYKKCIIDLKSKGMRVIIVLPPVYAAISEHVAAFGLLRKELAEIAKETKGIFWDFSTNKIAEDSSFFYNSNHLNSAGADRFSSILADSINHFTKQAN